jgi:transposase
VKRILRGHQREETARFIAFRSPWGFQAEFCTPAAAHEKGGVESEAGYFRRNPWVPVPEARDLEERNEQLLRACRQDQQRQRAGRESPVGVAMQAEQEHLLPLAGEGFALAEVSFPRVNWFRLRAG